MFYVSILVVIIDQVSKVLVKGLHIPWLGLNIQGMHPGESLTVLGNFLKITFVENPGMAFGLDFGDIAKFFLSSFSIIASVGISYYIYKERHKSLFYRLSLSLILGGAAGNLIDRVFYGVVYGYGPFLYGRVVDFILVDLPLLKFMGRQYDRFPVFNIADSAVTIGVILLLIYVNWFSGKAKQKNQDGENNDNGKDISL